MKLGIIYAGQGSQVVGMGKSFYPREIFDQNEDLKELCFNGPLEKLSYTPYTQPCMVMVATIITDLLKEHGIVPDYTAGLSLGEYSALYCAGVFKRQQVIDLARFRGKVMQEAVSEIESEMIAVLGMKEELLQDLCHQASSLGVVSISNYNCPGQTVISGEVKALEASAKIAKELGGRALPLKVSGPFHCSMYKDASYKFYEEVKKAEINDFKKVVYSNVKGAPYKKDDDIKELLRQQIMSPVLFEKSIRDLINKGVDTFIEVGPGKALSGFVKKIDKSVKIYNVCDIDSLESTISSLEL